MREFVIREDDANQRVDKFIQKTMQTMPKSLMYKYIRNKKIKVNKKRCEIAQRLVAGDRMQCYIAEEFFQIKKDDLFLQVPARLDIVYEDDHFIIMNKEKGLRAHRDTQEVQDNLADRMLHYLYLNKLYDPYTAQSFVPALCHRIDRNTQGLVIGAKSAQGLRVMNEKIALHEVEKTYICIVEGTFMKKEDVWIHYHQKQNDNTASILDECKEGYQEIKTGYRVIAEHEQFSLLDVDLYTGKSHQIRAVMAHMQHPLYGDVKYGAHKTKQMEYQALCAYRLKFAFHNDSDCMKKLSQREFILTKSDVQKRWEKITNKDEKKEK